MPKGESGVVKGEAGVEWGELLVVKGEPLVQWGELGVSKGLFGVVRSDSGCQW
jgi:hypothetical protein